MLPLSLSEAEEMGEPRTEKSIGFVDGESRLLYRYIDDIYTLIPIEAVALVVGLQVGSGILSVSIFDHFHIYSR